MLAASTGIPVFKLTEEESTRLLNMEAELHKRNVGKDDAITALTPLDLTGERLRAYDAEKDMYYRPGLYGRLFAAYREFSEPSADVI